MIMNPLTHHVYNLIILDESGSMLSIKQPTISGFNEIVETIRSVSAQFPEQEHFVSLVSFNSNGIKSIHWNEEASRLNKINDNMYKPNGSTPLFDAIGQSVNRLKNELPGNRGYNVLVTILTDGEENASRNYTAEQISKLISQLKEQAWTFAYIGANHDIVETASKLSITNTLEFKANDADMAAMFDTEREARYHYYKKVSKNSRSTSLDQGYFAHLKPEAPVDEQTPVDDKD
jgi:hypothetical protein